MAIKERNWFKTRKGVILSLVLIVAVLASLIIFFYTYSKPREGIQVNPSYTVSTVQGGYVFIDLSIIAPQNQPLKNVNVTVTDKPENWNVTQVKPSFFKEITRSNVSNIALLVSRNATLGIQNVSIKVSGFIGSKLASKSLIFEIKVNPLSFSEKYVSGVELLLPSKWKIDSFGNVLKGYLVSYGSQNLPLYYKLEWEPLDKLGNLSLKEYAVREVIEGKYQVVSSENVNVSKHSAIRLFFKRKGKIGILDFWFSQVTDRAYKMEVTTLYTYKTYLPLQITPWLPYFETVTDYSYYRNKASNYSLFVPLYWNTTLEERTTMKETNLSTLFTYEDRVGGVIEEFYVHEMDNVKFEVGILPPQINQTNIFEDWSGKLSYQLTQQGYKIEEVTDIKTSETKWRFPVIWRGFTMKKGDIETVYIMFTVYSLNNGHPYYGYLNLYSELENMRNQAFYLFNKVIYSFETQPRT